MKITEFKISKVSIPLKKTFKTALRQVNSAEDIIIKVITDTDEVGYGNAPPTAVITGDSQDSVIAAIREAVGYDIKIRLDANQGWSPKEAVRTIRKFENMGLDIELIEQPVKAHDFEGLKYVTDNVETNIMADESAFGPYEVFQLLSMRACDLINIKLMKAGGLHNAIKIASMAETMGVQCMMGCMLESKIGITAAASITAGKKIITKTDLDAAVLLASDPIVGGVSFCRNQILMPETPGLGITDIEGWQEIDIKNYK